MKKILAVILVAAACSSCGNDKKALKEEFVKNCMASAGTDPSNKKIHDAMKTYCDCSGEKVVNKFSTTEIAAFNGMSETEMQEKLMPVIKECLDDLQKTVMEGAAAESAGEESGKEAETAPAAEGAH